MSNTCAHCYGLIMEPGKAYGYAGKTCQCGWTGGIPMQYPQIPNVNPPRCECHQCTQARSPIPWGRFPAAPKPEEK